MHAKSIRHVLGVAFAALMLIGGSASFALADDRPNFLLIVADDLTWSDLGYEGNREIHTPHLDQLRTEGMHLTRMFTPATTCSPSRHALYTGLYSIRSGAYPNHTRVYEGTKSVFTHLKHANYRVALQNKSHVGPAASFPYEAIQGADDLTKTEAFIRRDPSQPWLLVYASNDPHGPWTRGPKKKYDPKMLTVPSYLHDNPTTRQLLASYYAEISQCDQQVGELMKLLKDCHEEDNTLVFFFSEQGSSFPYGGKWSVYDNGIRASTLVRWPGKIKPGSHSDALCQYVDIAPTLLEAAGIDATKIDVGCPDANGDTGFDGKNLLPVLQGEQEAFRDVIFSQQTTVGIHGYQDPYPMRAVRDNRYKLILNLAPDNTYFIGGIHRGQPTDSWRKDAQNNPQLAKRVEWLSHRPGEELYDLDKDPLETNNLADSPEHQKIKQRLRKEIDGWMAQQGDKGLETEMTAKSRQGKRKAEAKPKKGKNRKKAAT
ncbi:sulfatase family protein [Bremerella sp. P1]|uniref:sulfatase family protein n=1 Tax=Bremerella sp. P1 TaxID=3026424 RepID=UPI002367C9B8|nr:sulfatase [Bremerella sp. P1]WDI41758.1 sulfatase [Bremerella sp. P1]